MNYPFNMLQGHLREMVLTDKVVQVAKSVYRLLRCAYWKIGTEEPLLLEEEDTPGMKTIEELANFLNVPKDHTLKAVFYVADGQVVFAMIR